MSNEWTLLEIDNIPSDWFSFEYEIQQVGGYECRRHPRAKLRMIDDIIEYKESYEYRKPQPKAPTHEEIMTKWWRFRSGEDWERVSFYTNDGIYVFMTADMKYHVNLRCEYKKSFVGKESADIPPETTE